MPNTNHFRGFSVKLALIFCFKLSIATFPKWLDPSSEVSSTSNSWNAVLDHVRGQPEGSQPQADVHHMRIAQTTSGGMVDRSKLTHLDLNQQFVDDEWWHGELPGLDTHKKRKRVIKSEFPHGRPPSHAGSSVMNGHSDPPPAQNVVGQLASLSKNYPIANQVVKSEFPQFNPPQTVSPVIHGDLGAQRAGTIFGQVASLENTHPTSFPNVNLGYARDHVAPAQSQFRVSASCSNAQEAGKGFNQKTTPLSKLVPGSVQAVESGPSRSNAIVYPTFGNMPFISSHSKGQPSKESTNQGNALHANTHLPNPAKNDGNAVANHPVKLEHPEAALDQTQPPVGVSQSHTQTAMKGLDQEDYFYSSKHSRLVQAAESGPSCSNDIVYTTPSHMPAIVNHLNSQRYKKGVNQENNSNPNRYLQNLAEVYQNSVVRHPVKLEYPELAPHYHQAQLPVIESNSNLQNTMKGFNQENSFHLKNHNIPVQVAESGTSHTRISTAHDIPAIGSYSNTQNSEEIINQATNFKSNKNLQFLQKIDLNSIPSNQVKLEASEVNPDQTKLPVNVSRSNSQNINKDGQQETALNSKSQPITLHASGSGPSLTNYFLKSTPTNSPHVIFSDPNVQNSEERISQMTDFLPTKKIKNLSVIYSNLGSNHPLKLQEIPKQTHSQVINGNLDTQNIMKGSNPETTLHSDQHPRPVELSELGPSNSHDNVNPSPSEKPVIGSYPNSQKNDKRVIPENESLPTKRFKALSAIYSDLDSRKKDDSLEKASFIQKEDLTDLMNLKSKFHKIYPTQTNSPRIDGHPDGQSTQKIHQETDSSSRNNLRDDQVSESGSSPDFLANLSTKNSPVIGNHSKERSTDQEIIQEAASFPTNHLQTSSEMHGNSLEKDDERINGKVGYLSRKPLIVYSRQNSKNKGLGSTQTNLPAIESHSNQENIRDRTNQEALPLPNRETTAALDGELETSPMEPVLTNVPVIYGDTNGKKTKDSIGGEKASLLKISKLRADQIVRNVMSRRRQKLQVAVNSRADQVAGMEDSGLNAVMNPEINNSPVVDIDTNPENTRKDNIRSGMGSESEPSTIGYAPIKIPVMYGHYNGQQIKEFSGSEKSSLLNRRLGANHIFRNTISSGTQALHGGENSRADQAEDLEHASVNSVTNDGASNLTGVDRSSTSQNPRDIIAQQPTSISKNDNRADQDIGNQHSHTENYNLMNVPVIESYSNGEQTNNLISREASIYNGHLIDSHIIRKPRSHRPQYHQGRPWIQDKFKSAQFKPDPAPSSIADNNLDGQNILSAQASALDERVNELSSSEVLPADKHVIKRWKNEFKNKLKKVGLDKSKRRTETYERLKEIHIKDSTISLVKEGNSLYDEYFPHKIQLFSVEIIPREQATKKRYAGSRITRILFYLDYYHRLDSFHGLDSSYLGAKLENSNEILIEWFWMFIFKQTRDTLPLFGTCKIKEPTDEEALNLFDGNQKRIANILNCERPALDDIKTLARSLLDYWYKITSSKFAQYKQTHQSEGISALDSI
ncbi:hypothetical protein PGT21_014186 [Puccinia graminis f. sp. tritici]|uniref:Uncharacterized protein n=1 Tax=Puccinia graminis f. sp. tritici TaxID=56615 RepID=A0A5B0QA84_PUCGR|nr:hypothetical protein PGT21_014186 [Puccinia graminis f. sp. tritici]